MAADRLIERFRGAYSASGTLLHLNNAGLAPVSEPARQAVVAWVNRLHAEGTHCTDAYYAAIDEARGLLARLLGADADEIAFFQSTAGAVSQVAFALGLRAGDEIVVWDQEYGSNLYPWLEAARRAGAIVRQVPSGPRLETPVERLLDAVTSRTRVIAVSWVQNQTGAVTDYATVARFARERDIWTVMDAIQGIGLFAFDFRASGLDAACGGSHKWLSAPVGTGYLVIRAERVAELQPLHVGIQSYGDYEAAPRVDPTWREGARRFEAGSRQMLDIVALGASCQLIADTGVARIGARCTALARRLVDRLAALDVPVHSPHAANWVGAIVTFGAGDLEDIAWRLRRAGISFARRGPGIRLSPHAFNVESDIDRVMEALG
jgi:cysteine desulfurase / selenocysteine lyase